MIAYDRMRAVYAVIVSADNELPHDKGSFAMAFVKMVLICCSSHLPAEIESLSDHTFKFMY